MPIIDSIDLRKPALLISWVVMQAARIPEPRTQQWRESMNQLDLRMEFTPMTGLVISPGIRLMKRDVLAIADGQVDPVRTLRTKTAWPIGSVFYQPWKKFSVRGDFQSITNNTSYTRITPHTDVGTQMGIPITSHAQIVHRRQSFDTKPEAA